MQEGRMTDAPVFKHHRLPAKAPTTLVAGRWYNGFDCHDFEKIVAIGFVLTRD